MLETRTVFANKKPTIGTQFRISVNIKRLELHLAELRQVLCSVQEETVQLLQASCWRIHAFLWEGLLVQQLHLPTNPRRTYFTGSHVNLLQRQELYYSSHSCGGCVSTPRLPPHVAATEAAPAPLAQYRNIWGCIKDPLGH